MNDLVLFIWGSLITAIAGSAVFILLRVTYMEKEIEDGVSPDFRPGHPEESPKTDRQVQVSEGEGGVAAGI